MRSLDNHHAGPQSSKLAYWVGRTYLTVAGWDTEGDLPTDEPKAILIAAPHTSNWDLPFMLACAWVYRLDLSWIGKHTLFDGAGGKFLSWLGGVPVDRRARHGAVGQVIDKFEAAEKLILAIAPMGTRRKTPFWKSGFYHMAHGANVPVICTFLDFERKRCGVGPVFRLSGDMEADMDRIRAFYADISALRPDLQTDVRLKDEAPVPLQAVAE
jgi:Acyltransferase